MVAGVGASIIIILTIVWIFLAKDEAQEAEDDDEEEEGENKEEEDNDDEDEEEAESDEDEEEGEEMEDEQTEWSIVSAFDPLTDQSTFSSNQRHPKRVFVRWNNFPDFKLKVDCVAEQDCLLAALFF